MTANRRQFVATSAAALAFSGFSRLAQAQTSANPAPYLSQVQGYGDLVGDPKAIIDLPAGFSYTVVSQRGETMSDGLITPGKMDGMGCFPLWRSRVALVRNHEISPYDTEITAFGPKRGLAAQVKADRFYDTDSSGLPLGGGTTTLIYDLKHRRLESSHLSLAGTMVNCAGGRTPWGSWLSCEETTVTTGQQKVNKPHGFVYEVPSKARGIVDPEPITAMGRFRHEAAAIDPRSGIVYMTEDVGDGMGLFYRYLPNDPRHLHKGGRLQALALPEGKDGDPRNWNSTYWSPGDWRSVHWIDLDGVDNPHEDLRNRGHEKGAAWFARGEGIFWGKDELFFTCTSGGPKKGSQIMRYVPSPQEGQAGEASEPGRLQLFVEPTDDLVMRMADNIAIAPWGHLVVCEDKIGGTNFLRGVTSKGEVYTLARNAHLGNGDVGGTSEFAGCCFSPDGTTLFVNIYSPGLTLAITGPWSRFRDA